MKVKITTKDKNGRVVKTERVDTILLQSETDRIDDFLRRDFSDVPENVPLELCLKQIRSDRNMKAKLLRRVMKYVGMRDGD